MEERKYCNCGFIFTFIFILALPATFLIILNPNDYYWEIGDLITLPKIFGNTSSHDHTTKIPSLNYFANEIGPNLSSCHDSHGRPDLVMNCCPRPADAAVKAVEFRFPDISKSGLRVRRPLHQANAEYLAKYTKAMNIIKSLPPTDPRSFPRQAIIHCTFCSGAFDMNHYINDGPGDAADNVAWPSINIHRQWLFYPFHRMYLYFHERILASLLDDDTFALPFWNWDNPEAMFFPELFLSPPFYDTQRDFSHFSHVMDLSFAGKDKIPIPSPPDQVRANLGLMYNQVVSASKRAELFMGCPLKPSRDGFCDGPGTLEAAPHNHVHSWVGSANRKGRENMGSFYSAAWDPSFYSHHGNIDRMWEVWRDVHGIDVPIHDPVWLNSYFYFYDETLTLVKIKVSDVLNITKLGYAYEKVDLLWLNHRPKPSVEPTIAKLELKNRELRNDTTSDGLLKADVIGQSQRMSSPMRVKVYRPKRLRTEREKKEEEEVLVVYGIDTKDNVDTMVKFDVYVNLVDETKVGPSYREFVGTYVNLHQEKSKRSSTLKLGISEALEDLEADEDESIWVTLMPMTKSCESVTIDGIRIDYMR